MAQAAAAEKRAAGEGRGVEHVADYPARGGATKRKATAARKLGGKREYGARVKEEGDTIFESALAEFEEAVDAVAAAGTNIKTHRRARHRR